MADDFLIGAACCSSVENPGMVMFQAHSVWIMGGGGGEVSLHARLLLQCLVLKLTLWREGLILRLG